VGTSTLSPTNTASGTIGDLTNQDSPQAATFRNGASYTPLVTPQLFIRLEKVAEVRHR
jgi:hypothetical protein